ncbi:MAG: GGDEF domain-containing protein [Pseudomonadota bacterium]
MKLRKLRIEELLPMMLASAGIIFISPLVVVRALDGDYVIAAIDAILVSGEITIAWAIYQRGAVRAGSVALAIFCALALIGVIYAKGIDVIFWAYPVIVAAFFLMKPKEAAALTVLMVLAIAPVLVTSLSVVSGIAIGSSFFVTIVVAGAFAALTLEQRRLLEQMTMIDPLTGAGNRRALNEALTVLSKTTPSSEESISMVMLDIDYFKRINDEYGHAVGDRVLVAVSDCIARHIRSDDTLYRVGGEEFVIVARSAGLDSACRLGESLRKRIAALSVQPDDRSLAPFSVTVSLGVAERLRKEPNDVWYQRADEALYEAKRNGRNQICLAEKTISLSGSASYTAQPEIVRENPRQSSITRHH